MFRVHERLLTDRYSSFLARLSFWLMLFFWLTCLCLFLLINVSIEGKSHCVPSSSATIAHYTVFDDIGSRANFSVIVSNLREMVTMNQTVLAKHNFSLVNATLLRSCLFR